MIFTCQKCTRQHEWPAGWPAGAVFGCWDCGTIYVADAIDTAKPATEAELARFAESGGLAMQRVILAHCRTRFLGRTGMIPWQEYQDVAKHGAKVHGFETQEVEFGGDADATLEEITKILEGECLHCCVLRLIQFRQNNGAKIDTAQDVMDLVKVACEVSAVSVKPDPESRGRAVVALERMVDLYSKKAFQKVDSLRTPRESATAPLVPR